MTEQRNSMSAELHKSYAHLERKVAERTIELATLNAISAVVSRSLDLDEILHDALCETLTMLKMEAGAILLAEPDEEVMTLQVHQGFSDELVQAVQRVRLDEGITGQAATQGKPVVLDTPDYARADYIERLAPLAAKEGIQTLASTPIIHKGQVLGALNLATRQARAFPPQGHNLLAAIGRQIGMAVDNARLYEQAQQELAERKRAEEELRRVNKDRARRNRELVLLNRVIAATTSRVELKAVLEAVCRELTLAFNVPTVAAALLNERRTALTVVAEHKSEERPSALGAVIPIEGNPATQYVLEHKAPLAVTDAQHDPRMAPVHDLMRQRSVVSLLLLPLIVRDEVVGTIGMDVIERREFTAQEIALAANAAAAASQALENARAEEALRESEQRLKLAIEGADVGLWDQNLVGDEAVIIQDWTESLGYAPGEIAPTYESWNQLVHPEDKPKLTAAWQKHISGEAPLYEVEHRVQTKSGDWAWVLLRGRVVVRDDDGKPLRVTGIHQDITARKRAEEELRRAKEAAEAANRAKSTFLANMSHELRTPLNAILGFAQLMTRDPGLTTEQRENLATICRSGEHLLALINDVLETSKIEAGRVTLQKQSFDLYRLLDGLQEMFHLRAADKGLVLIFDRAPDVPQYVQTDESKLRQVLMNLLGNAVKFTQEGGVTLRVGHRDDEVPGKDIALLPTPYSLLHFEVEDTGLGIAPEELEAVFDPFVQASGGHAHASQEGTGLGLSISRQFVRLMGGDLTVHSELGTGSLFKFDVSIAIAEKADVTEIQSSQRTRRAVGLEPDQPVYRLLVVEDQDANRRLLVNLLTALGTPPLGFEVREAINGQEAIELWERWEPHLIWMDLRMPVMDGYAATKRIKATAQGQATVIVALTASAFEQDRALILSEGCDDFVRKPFRAEEITDMLAKHLGVRFVYEDQADEPCADTVTIPSLHDTLSPANLVVLPPEWIAKLRQAAIQLDADVVLDLIEQIREQHAPLAEALAHLVRDFRFDIILAATQPVEE